MLALLESPVPGFIHIYIWRFPLVCSSLIINFEDWKKRPADSNIKVEYDLLMLSGSVLLDCDNKPVLDVPRLPLTLVTDIENWFITGLQRSLRIELKE